MINTVCSMVFMNALINYFIQNANAAVLPLGAYWRPTWKYHTNQWAFGFPSASTSLIGCIGFSIISASAFNRTEDDVWNVLTESC